MTCWRCGRVEHAEWCSMPGGCHHCGWSPHRWWCATGHVYGWTDPSAMGHAVIIKGAA